MVAYFFAFSICCALLWYVLRLRAEVHALKTIMDLQTKAHNVTDEQLRTANVKLRERAECNSELLDFNVKLLAQVSDLKAERDELVGAINSAFANTRRGKLLCDSEQV